MIKYLLIILMSNFAWASDVKEFEKFCKKGATLGQKFLQAASQTKELKEIQKDCIASPKVLEVFKKIKKDEIKIFACGSGVGLALFFYKQDNLLKSPRVAKVMESCHTK